MSYQKTKGKWRKYLDSEERAIVDEYDIVRKEFARLAAQVNMIRNRAIQRSKYKPRKETK